MKHVYNDDVKKGNIFMLLFFNIMKQTRKNVIKKSLTTRATTDY